MNAILATRRIPQSARCNATVNSKLATRGDGIEKIKDSVLAPLDTCACCFIKANGLLGALLACYVVGCACKPNGEITVVQHASATIPAVNRTFFVRSEDSVYFVLVGPSAAASDPETVVHYTGMALDLLFQYGGRDVDAVFFICATPDASTGRYATFTKTDLLTLEQSSRSNACRVVRAWQWRQGLVPPMPCLGPSRDR